jgi:hypothetical protein
MGKVVLTKAILKQKLQEITDDRDNLKLANTVLNNLVGQQYAEIQIRKTELRIIKQEIQKLKQ